jgi:hypothetical protein
VGDALAHLREEHESVSGRRDQLIRELGQVRADKVRKRHVRICMPSLHIMCTEVWGA